ncbi:hypothetical protein B0H14DRAFT_3150620 [Mycena olivaceomarginata]|nr:hypothetical protein B0H14DRAFT_3150620 [Mycena olivaceomarginata]
MAVSQRKSSGHKRYHSGTVAVLECNPSGSRAVVPAVVAQPPKFETVLTSVVPPTEVPVELKLGVPSPNSAQDSVRNSCSSSPNLSNQNCWSSQKPTQGMTYLALPPRLWDTAAYGNGLGGGRGNWLTKGDREHPRFKRFGQKMVELDSLLCRGCLTSRLWDATAYGDGLGGGGGNRGCLTSRLWDATAYGDGLGSGGGNWLTKGDRKHPRWHVPTMIQAREVQSTSAKPVAFQATHSTKLQSRNREGEEGRSSVLEIIDDARFALVVTLVGLWTSLGYSPVACAVAAGFVRETRRCDASPSPE